MAEEMHEDQVEEDFNKWLVGKGRAEDHMRTPWERTPLVFNPSVRDYLKSFTDKKWEVTQKLNQVFWEVQKGDPDVETLFHYYRYFVRGNLDPDSLDNVDFLSFWRELFELPTKYGADAPEELRLLEKNVTELLDTWWFDRDGNVPTGRAEVIISRETNVKQALLRAEKALTSPSGKEWEEALADVNRMFRGTAAWSGQFAQIIADLDEVDLTDDQKLIVINGFLDTRLKVRAKTIDMNIGAQTTLRDYHNAAARMRDLAQLEAGPTTSTAEKESFKVLKLAQAARVHSLKNKYLKEVNEYNATLPEENRRPEDDIMSDLQLTLSTKMLERQIAREEKQKRVTQDPSLVQDDWGEEFEASHWETTISIIKAEVEKAKERGRIIGAAGTQKAQTLKLLLKACDEAKALQRHRQPNAARDEKQAKLQETLDTIIEQCSDAFMDVDNYLYADLFMPPRETESLSVRREGADGSSVLTFVASVVSLHPLSYGLLHDADPSIQLNMNFDLSAVSNNDDEAAKILGDMLQPQMLLHTREFLAALLQHSSYHVTPSTELYNLMFATMAFLHEPNLSEHALFSLEEIITRLGEKEKIAPESGRISQADTMRGSINYAVQKKFQQLKRQVDDRLLTLYTEEMDTIEATLQEMVESVDDNNNLPNLVSFCQTELGVMFTTIGEVRDRFYKPLPPNSAEANAAKQLYAAKGAEQYSQALNEFYDAQNSRYAKQEERLMTNPLEEATAIIDEAAQRAP